MRIVRNFFVAAVVVVYALVAQPGPLQLYDIVPFSPGNEAVVVDDILRTHRETGLEIFLYSVSLDPRGNPAKENVHKAIESVMQNPKSQFYLAEASANRCEICR